MKYHFIFLLFISSLSFSQNKKIDYSLLKNWASHPALQDSADAVPGPYIVDFNDTAQIDVFFIHPTSYVSKKINESMNAPVDNAELNHETDKGTMYYQASVFNNIGRIYSPRYRQAHLSTYWLTDKEKQKQIFDIAYQDVKDAFEYYLAHYNHGRPIIIASHSQGTNHAQRLLKEYFDNKPLQSQLVAAYLVGMPILKNEFENIPACQDSLQTGCFCTWRTFRYGSKTMMPDREDIVCTNPLTWETNEAYASKDLNFGGIVKDFFDIKKGLCDAKVQRSILWTHKPKFKGSIFVQISNYHIVDYNLFYMNIKYNAHQRVLEYLKKNNMSKK